MQKSFVESTQFDGRIDKVNNRINGIACLTSISKNNNFYTQQALESACSIIKQQPVKSFLDHGNPSSVMNLLGAFSNPRLDGSTVRADLTIFESSQGKDLLLDLAQNHPDAIGFSINARGLFSENDAQGREVCQKIIQLRSIDAVSFPASTTTLWESTDSADLQELRERIKSLELTNSYLRKQVDKLKGNNTLRNPIESACSLGDKRQRFWADLDRYL